MGVYWWLFLLVDINVLRVDDVHHHPAVFRVAVELFATSTTPKLTTTKSRNAHPPEDFEDELKSQGIFSQASAINMDKNARLLLPPPDLLSDVDVNRKCCVQKVVSPGLTYSNNIGSGDRAPRSA